MKYGILLKSCANQSEFLQNIEESLDNGCPVKFGSGGIIQLVARPMTINPDHVALLLEGSLIQYLRDRKVCRGKASIIRGWPRTLLEN